jgi:hypothetical protein
VPQNTPKEIKIPVRDSGGKSKTKKSRPNLPQMQYQQAVQPVDILFQSDLKVNL